MKYSLRSLMIVAMAGPPLLALAFFAVTSFSSPDPFEYRPELVRTTGVLRLNGEPVSDATITFLFDDGDFAIGISNEKGEFDLTFMGYLGCPPKPAKVCISRGGLT